MSASSWVWWPWGQISGAHAGPHTHSKLTACILELTMDEKTAQEALPQPKFDEVWDGIIDVKFQWFMNCSV